MAVIHLTTFINAPVERCFDLSRSIDLHQKSTSASNERAIAGVTKGLIKKGESVTWRARHLGVEQNLTVEITEMIFPSYFEDRMVRGAFKSMFHSHMFFPKDGGTMMKDLFEFESPLGPLGTIVNGLFLTGYMTRFLEERNAAIKATAESEDWKQYI